MLAIVARLIRFGAVLVALTVFGAVGYRLIEGWSWLDAIYMTVITLSTVGFQEARPLSPAGRGFSILLIVAGVGSALYLITMIAQLLIDGELGRTILRERMAMRIRKKVDHVIVAGYGRFGKAVVDELRQAGRDVVVIDPDADLVPTFEAADLAYVLGTASNDRSLAEAAIEGASAVVAATPSDAENVFITLAAKEHRPDLRVLARYESPEAARRLRRAGADQIVSPFQMGGTRAAASILRPAVVDFLEIVSPHGAPEVDIEQVVVGAGSGLVGRTLGDIERSLAALRIVAVRPDHGAIQIAPPPETVVAESFLLVVVGERAPLLSLAAQAEPGGAVPA